jgi:hypothetical protein
MAFAEFDRSLVFAERHHPMAVAMEQDWLPTLFQF